MSQTKEEAMDCTTCERWAKVLTCVHGGARRVVVCPECDHASSVCRACFGTFLQFQQSVLDDAFSADEPKS
jgi:hypothetical protein